MSYLFLFTAIAAPHARGQNQEAATRSESRSYSASGHATANSQVATSSGESQTPLTSSRYIAESGLSVEQLVAFGLEHRADLVAARKRVAIAEGNLAQAGLRPNPQLSTEYGSTGPLMGGQAEYEFLAGISQLFETGGKRSRRVAVAELALAQTKAEVQSVEQQLASEIRASYARAVAEGRQLDTIERVLTAGEEQTRITAVRLKEGDAARVDVNLVRNEADRLRAQAIGIRSQLETELVSMRGLIGAEATDPLQIAPMSSKLPKLDLTLLELTKLALRQRPDLQAARLGEQLASARLHLAQAQSKPDITGSISYGRTKRITDLPAVLGVGPVSQLENTLKVGLAVDLPLFNRNQGGIAAAVGERGQAESDRQFLESSIKRDVALAYSRYRAAADTLDLYTTAIIPRSADNLRIVRLGYSEGEFSVFDVVSEQRRVLDNQTGYGDALRDYYTSLTELERAVGSTLFSGTGTSRY